MRTITHFMDQLEKETPQFSVWLHDDEQVFSKEKTFKSNGLNEVRQLLKSHLQVVVEVSDSIPNESQFILLLPEVNVASPIIFEQGKVLSLSY